MIGAFALLALQSEPAFVERSDCGVDFVHHRFMTQGKKYLCETAGSGVALFDYDRDGDLDLYCVQCCPLPGYQGAGKAEPDALYRNDREKGGGWHFTRVPAEWTETVTAADGTQTTVTKKLGLGDLQYGMGAYCPDLDNDGWPDLFITNVGTNVLYRNNRDGTFSDVTAGSGIAGDGWSAAAAFADLDGDGDLALYIANYALIDIAKYKVCGTPPKVSYCHPDTLRGAADRLYLNDSGNDGTFHFTDVTKSAGIVEPAKQMKGLCVLPFDHDGDGRLDLYVANDADPNFLWINQSDASGMHFDEQAGWLGAAVSGKGVSQSCMGSDVADVDGDLRLDLFSANFGKEASILYRRGADEFYEDVTRPSGLYEPSYLFTGFGARFFDYDHDADQDLMVVNGHIVDDAHELDPSQTFEQVPHLFENRGDGRFDQVGPKLSPFFTKPNLGRGLARGDLDADGDQDVVVLENDHPLAGLENRCESLHPANRWIGFELAGAATAAAVPPNAARKSPRDPIGATVTIDCAGKKQIEIVTGSASFLSWSDLRLVFGLGPVAADARVAATIHWPSGRVQTLESLEPGKYHHVAEPVEAVAK